MEIEQINRYVGSKIKEYRKYFGMSQEELAKKIGVGKTTISNYEVGLRSPKKTQMIKLSEVFGITIDDFFPTSDSSATNNSPTLSEINRISAQLDKPRQKVVLNTASSQLDEQNKENKKKSKLISINEIPDDLPPYISRKILENFIMPANTMEYEADEDMVDVPILGRIAAGLPLDAIENFDGTRPVPAHFLSSARDYYWLMVEGHSMEPKIPFGAYVLIEAMPDVTDGTIGAVLFQEDSQATLKKVYHEINCLRLVSINKDFKDQFATKDNPAAVIGQAVKVEIDL